MIKILAISGSLRKHSLNTALLRAAIDIAPSGIEIRYCEGLGDLPLFNPDLEGLESLSVLSFRAELRAADGVVIASPEYAHGVTGVLKNALDWVVGSGEFMRKPVCCINTSSRSTIAYESLKEILKTMDAKIIDEASRVIGLPNGITKEGILEHSHIREQLHGALSSFASKIKSFNLFSQMVQDSSC